MRWVRPTICVFARIGILSIRRIGSETVLRIALPLSKGLLHSGKVRPWRDMRRCLVLAGMRRIVKYTDPQDRTNENFDMAAYKNRRGSHLLNLKVDEKHFRIFLRRSEETLTCNPQLAQ